MLPGKKYRPDDFLRIAWARKWFIVIPTVVFAAATFAWTSFLPDRYRSQTVLSVLPQRVPPSYVRPTVMSSAYERIQNITQLIRSPARLARIIDEFHLDEREGQTLDLDDLIADMQKAIKVNVARPARRNADAASFTIIFEASHPRTAMQVTERLASIFAQENVQNREVLAGATNQFLEAELEAAHRRLIEHEEKLEAFRRRNAGRLPTQAQSNVQLMQTTQVRLQANADGANKDQDRLHALEAAIAEAVAAGSGPFVAGDNAEGVRIGTAAQQLEMAKTTLRNLEVRLKPEHPDVISAKREIVDLQRKADAEALEITAAPPKAPVTNTGRPSQALTRLAAMRLEVEEIRKRLQTRKEEEARLKNVLASYTARLEAAPSLESEMTELTRGYSTLQEQYVALLRRSEEAKIAMNLERQAIGEQFKVVEAATLPDRPSSPDRFRLNLLGAGAGFALGVLLIALLEYRDTTLKTDDDVVITLALPVLAVIPRMITTGERRGMQRRRNLVALSTSLAGVLVVAAVVAWRMQLLERWVR